MTYAEQFNAPSWLEDPSQWLWWAMQSRINGNLQDAQYNLKQFWTALDGVKKNADESTWPEIMALDSQSHIQAANITSGIINQMETDISTVSAWIGLFGWKGLDAKAAIAKMQDQRTQELATAASLADQARTATAMRVQAVADGRLSQDDAERAQENKNIESIISANSSLDLLGVPIWAWAAGAAALFLLLKVK
jgi:hypothetical protein